MKTIALSALCVSVAIITGCHTTQPQAAVPIYESAAQVGRPYHTIATLARPDLDNAESNTRALEFSARQLQADAIILTDHQAAAILFDK